MKPHKHAELIKAWADGAEIQIFNPDNMEWEDLQCTPAWNDQMKYRIKPEPKPDVVLYAYANFESRHVFAANEYEDKGFDNLKLTFDGETGELKSAEVWK